MMSGWSTVVANAARSQDAVHLKRSRGLVIVALAGALVAGSCGSSTADSVSERSDGVSSGTVSSGTVSSGTVSSELDGSGSTAGLATTSTEPEVAQTTTTQNPTTTTELSWTAEGLEQGEPPEVVLLDPGVEPRTELRLDLADRQSEALLLTQTVELTQSLDGIELPSAGAITIESTMLQEVLVVDGFYIARSTFTNARPAEGTDLLLVAALEASLDPMIGLEIVTKLDTLGNIYATGLANPEILEGIDPAVATVIVEMSSLTQLANPLPIDPVGVGAIWQTTQELMLSGIAITQVTIYTLTDIDGTSVTMTTATKQAVERGTIMESGAVDLVIESWDVTGAGTITMDLTKLVPTSEGSISSIQTFSVGTGVAAQTLLQNLTQAVSVRPG